jgi:hypothetical protein
MSVEVDEPEVLVLDVAAQDDEPAAAGHEHRTLAAVCRRQPRDRVGY